MTSWLASKKTPFAAVTLVAMMLVAAGTAGAESNPIVFQSTEAPPYWSASLPNNGFGGAILDLMSEVAGVKYSIEYLPVKRFRNSSSLYVVGDPDLLTNKKLRAVFPIGIFHSSFFYYKPLHDTLQLNSLSSLSGLTLGVLRGTLEDPHFFTNHGIKVEESDSVESLLKKLKKGRIDTCILVSGTGQYTIKKIFPTETDAFAEINIPSLSRPITIMIDNSNPEEKAVAQRYRKVLVDVIRSPKYKEILERFYGKNKIPSTRDAQLNKFIQYYASTWGD